MSEKQSSHSGHSGHSASHSGHTSHSAAHSHGLVGEIEHDLKDAAREEHKVARATHKADSAVYMTEVIASGKPRRILRYFARKFAYKLFARFMAKTVNRI